MIVAVFAAAMTACANEFDVLRVRWCEMLTQGTNATKSDLLYSNWIAQVESTAQTYWNVLDTSSNRTNLFYNYPNLSTDSSDITTTYEHLRAMALAYAVPGSALKGNSTLLRDTTNSLNWMTRFYSPTGAIYDNWYDFEIAIPRALNDTVLLLYSNMAPSQLNNYMSAIEHFAPTPNYTSIASPVTGYNKVWKALIVAVRGVIVQDAAKIELGKLALSDVFANVTTGDGFYTDGSFIFHDEYAYNTGYGIGLLDTMGLILQLLRGSSWEPVDPAQTNVFRWVYEAYEPFIVNGAAMEMVDGRYHTRDGDSHLRGHDLMGAILRIAQVAPPVDAAAFKAFLKGAMLSDTSLDFVSNQTPPYSVWANSILTNAALAPLADVAQHRQFPSMDRVLHHTTNWTFALSMSSSRVANYESTRGENLKGWFSGEGMTYLYNNDLTHYSDNYWSTIDPYRLPGTTVDTITRTNGSGESYRSPNNQVGGASILGLYGVAAMHLNAYGTSTMSARNSWFMFGTEIVCVGNSISSVNGRETIVENRRLGVYGNNPFTVNGVSKPTGAGWAETLGATSWAHLAGSAPGADIGYFFPSPTTVKAIRENRSGRFYDINTTYGSKTPATRTYLTMYLDHGTNSNSTNYTYVLLPGYSAAQVAAYAASPEISILQNNSTATAVTKPKLGITAVNFWKDTSNQVAGISSDHKAAVILRNDGSVLDIGASDPTQTNKVGLRIEVNAPGVSVMSADPGVTVLQVAPTLKLLLNTSNKFGATLHARILMNASGQRPTVTLSASCDANVDAPGTFALTADARDLDGTVARVDFYSSTTRVAQVFGPSAPANVTVSNLAAGNYDFKAVAVDNAGLSGTSAVVSIVVTAPRGTGRGTGLVGEYYKDLGEFRVLSMVRTDTNINFSWPNYASHPIAQSDHFTVRWTGKLQAQHSGWHQFFTQTDEGVRLWVDGRLLIDDWWKHPKTLVEDAAGMSLIAGRYYDIRMEFFENTEPAVARLLWQAPGGVKELVPQSQLYPASQGLMATYYNGISLVSSAAQRVRTEDAVNFLWGTNTPDQSILSVPFAARWSGKVRADTAGSHMFFTLSDDAVRLFVNGQLLVNNWTPHSLTENSNSIILPVAGQYYDVSMEYFNQAGTGTAVLSWQPPGGVKQVIPSANLTPYQNNNPPLLGAIDDRIVDRDTLVTFTAVATDPDGAAQTLTYSLDAGAPAGATINPTNGIFAWTPSSPLPGGNYAVTVRVTDNGSPAMSDSRPMTITVKVVNSPPSIGTISNQVVDPGNAVSVMVPVSDSDVPAQTLTRSLLASPADASINASGVFNWIPSVADVSTTNLIVVKVTDDGIPPLSATQAFTIVVTANLPCFGYKGDVAPRLGGNGAVTIADWVQLGRFAAGTAEFSNACEFAAADCAPKPCGDGAITISDWVQAGRYAAGLDSLVLMSNCPRSTGFVPAGIRLPSPIAAASGRRLSVGTMTIEQGRTNVVPVMLDAEGGENALGFSLRFDTNLVSIVSVRPGKGASAAALQWNASVPGFAGVAIALPPGETFLEGRAVVAELLMRTAVRMKPVSTPVILIDQPVSREIDDADARMLSAQYSDGTLTITSGSAVLLEPLTLDSGGKLRMTLVGEAGTTWALQSSTNLMEWKPIGTVTNVTGRVDYLDSTSERSGHRFYRAIRME